MRVLGWIFLMFILVPLALSIVSWLGLVSPGLLIVIVLCITAVIITKIVVRR